MLLNTYYANEENKLDKKLSLYQADPKFYIKMPSGEEAPVFDYKNFPFEIMNPLWILSVTPSARCTSSTARSPCLLYWYSGRLFINEANFS